MVYTYLCVVVVPPRSLVALSLILAMLLFKPAPIYILDEVDAALDLSHTQNIGQMIKSHFKHSQVTLCLRFYVNTFIIFHLRELEKISGDVLCVCVCGYVFNEFLFRLDVRGEEKITLANLF